MSTSTALEGLLGRRIAPLLVVVFVAVGLWALVFYGEKADPDTARVQLGDRDIVLVELAGSLDAARTLVCTGVDTTTPESERLAPNLRPRATIEDCRRPVGYYRHALNVDFLLIAGYLVSLGGLCLLGTALFRGQRARRVARAAFWGTVIAAALDVVENLLLYVGLDGLPDDHGWVWRWAAAAAVTKFALLLPVGIVALTAAVVAIVRAWPRQDDETSWVNTSQPGAPVGSPAPDVNVLAPPQVFNDRGKLWPGTGGRPLTPAEHLGREAAQVGVCVSGGGIRSATVTLGALQELRRAGILAKARYLVSVSGGGYLTGALRLALQPLPDTVYPDTVHDAGPGPGGAFAPNSPEVDHLRRHGRYVADSAREWVEAMGTLLRGLLASLGMLAGLVTIVGLVLGRFYFAVPLLHTEELSLPTRRGSAPGFPHLSPGGIAAFFLLLALALVLWFSSVIFLTRDRWARWLRRVAMWTFVMTLVVGLLAIGIPAMVWGYVRFLWWLDDQGEISPVSAVTGGSIGTVLLAYAGTLVSILWRRREKIGSVRKGLAGKTSGVQRRSATGLTQRLIVWFVLLVLLVAFGAVLTAVLWVSTKGSTFALLTEGPFAPGVAWWPQWYVVVVPVAFVLVATLVDQTWMSLHPFYRRRLATAFAVRRGRLDSGAEVAVPYDFSEPTALSTHSVNVEGMPQVIFAAAANVSGFDRTPPGRRATPYTFSCDWVGGPQVGYVRTGALEENVSEHIRRDLTVQSAMAVSGAAFASAMGRQARAFQTLLALSNARLGTWLPNPAWLSERPDPPDWREPRLPAIRRVTYLLREVLGSYDPADRLLLVTDGGHYENLGLVELLRHCCRTVYCIDSSGDSPPLAGTLGDAIALAQEELGVSITLDNPLDLVPGSGDALEPGDALSALSARLSKAVVITGTIIYPHAFKATEEAVASNEGRLVVAKTRLTAQMSAELMSYAQNNPVFPHDSTGDQWFDQGQFNAYHRLGTYLGRAAAAIT